MHEDPETIHTAHERDDDGHFMHPDRGTSAPEFSQDRDLFGKPPKHHRDWSHRRGEPRTMALFWMIYLMGATVIMFSSMSRAHAISHEITRPAARLMMVIVMVGVCVLWPMLRLSQRHPAGGHVWFYLRDVIVLFLPLQAVVWPHVSTVLAHWPVAVIATLTLLFAGWLLLLAGVLAMASSSISRAEHGAMPRAIWMLVILLIVFAAPIFAIISGTGSPAGLDQPRLGWLLSPVPGVLELLRDRDATGVPARVYPQQLRLLIAIVCVGLALLLIARAIEVARARIRA